MPAHLITLLPCVACTSFARAASPRAPGRCGGACLAHHFLEQPDAPVPRVHAAVGRARRRLPRAAAQDTPGWTPWYRSKTSSMRGSFSGW